MAGMVQTEVNERLIKWVKSGDDWTITLVKDEENPDSDGHTNLRKETVLQTFTYTDS